ncbi:hypothetical protein [uncultured Pontibacter sp.]|uniref:hypothetical protein n=1 Tax=uncultured Pontibacter sp. TaxID=453356 RepID=UPI002604511D|nr:hypothetical protein [uncultured Pontibacter sp.]
MSTLEAPTTNQFSVYVYFNKNKSVKFPSTVYYTIDKNDGFYPQQRAIQIPASTTQEMVEFTVDRQTYDYNVSVSFDQCIDAYYSPVSKTILVPKKTSTGGTNTAWMNGHNDAMWDNQNDPLYGQARPHVWGYYYPSQNYTDYMNSYNSSRFMIQ